jgi:dienelactone hydrolase
VSLQAGLECYLMVILAGLFAGTSAVAGAELSTTESARLRFDSVTLSEPQFLTGAKAGQPVVIWGDLRLPATREGRLPVVILVHGSGGVGPHEERWADEFAGIGVATFILDSFSARGIGETAEDQSRLSLGAMIVDAYRGAELLASHPRIDSNRIALMGFSRGGYVSLYASLTRFQRLHRRVNLDFVAYLAFYPFCNATFVDDEQVSDRPIRIFHGTADDYTPIGPCREYVERLRRAGRDVQLIEYPGAQHAFDSPGRVPSLYLPLLVNPSRCFFVEQTPGVVVHRDSGRPVDFKDACFSRGVTLGYDARAHADATRSIKALLAAVFKRSD